MVDFWAKSGGSTSGADGAAGDTSRPSKKARKEVIRRFVVPIPEDCLAAAEAFVEFMYSGTLTLAPPEAVQDDVRCILKAAALADAWRLPTCVKQCLAQLTELASAYTLHLDDILSTLPLPESITSMSEFNLLLHTNYDHPTLTPFTTQADTLVTCKGDRGKQFCALSPMLITLWAECDIMEGEDGSGLTLNEETIVVLLTRWWLAQTPAIQQDEDLCLALSHTLRMGGLSAVYLTSVLPELPWFRGAQSPAYTQVLTRKLLGPTIAARMPTTGLPGNWAEGAASTDPASQLCKLNGEGPLEQRTPAAYDCGFLWYVWMDCKSSDNYMKVQVGVSSPLEGTPFFDKALLYLRGMITISVRDGATGDVLWQESDVEVHGVTSQGVAGAKVIKVPRRHLAGKKVWLEAKLL